MRSDFCVSLRPCLFALDFSIKFKLYLSNHFLFIFCNIMNYSIPSSYQPEQPSFLPYPVKPTTMDYMPEYSAPVSSISSTPVQPIQSTPPVQSVQPIPIAPVATVIPMSPEPNYVPPELRRIVAKRLRLGNPNNRLTSFLNEGMFYIDYQHDPNVKNWEYKVYPTNLYGEMDDSGAPIMTVRARSSFEG